MNAVDAYDWKSIPTSNRSEDGVIQSGCIQLPPWLHDDDMVLRNLPSSYLHIQLLVIFVLTQGLHHLFFKHLGLQPLVSQIVAGILLSPKVSIGKLRLLQGLHYLIFPSVSEEAWKTLASLGYNLTLFLIAVKMDFSMIRKNGKKPFVIGLLALKIPSLINWIIAHGYGHFVHLNDNSIQTTDLRSTASLVTLTSFSVVAILLSDLKLLNSELGRLALSSAIVSEIGSILLTICSKAQRFWDTKHDKKALSLDVFGILGLLLSSIFIIRPGVDYLIRQTPKGRPVKNGCFILTLLITLVAALVTDASGEFVTLGFYIIGAVIRDGPPLGFTIVHKLESFVVGMLQPFFITTTVMRADVFKFQLGGKLGYGQLLLTLTAIVTKIIICLACGLFYNMTIQDSLTLAAIMSSKGILDIAAYNMFNETKMIQDSTFSYLVLVTTVVAIVVPISIRCVYNPLRKYAGYEKRDIMHSKSDAPLRILACVSRTDQVSSIANLLSFSRVSKGNPVIVDVLHLIKLVGRCQPIFISHELQTKKATSISYSEDVIWGLKSLMNDNTEGVMMHYYTTVSPQMGMHEDICTLALNKLASLVILPFHRKINFEGSIEHEDYTQKALNISVLERAPCSVGIYIDRGHDLNFKARQEKTMSVAVIFIGGKDDREAVSYARRIAKGKNVEVAVIRLIALGEEHHSLSLLDSLILSSVEQCRHSNPNFKYEEVVVKDGPDTVTVLRWIVKDFDLIVVGRRFHDMDCTQTSCLKEWSEVPELGILGDLLASPDLHCRTSVLVVQQQKLWTGRREDCKS